ncbi:MAG: outer membrane lipoprotein carrier protein LolA, partial [Flammeovirgaceae bacterium]|nr:outer membrane lipoprotein carrier protein LolA [Flammeovirgaceae bacterium]
MTISKKLVFAALFSLGTLSGFAQYDPNALEILEAMSKKYKAIPAFEANLTSTLVNESEGIKEEFKGKITVKGEKFKLELEDQVIINNGTTVWTYIQSANEVTIDNFDPKSDDINPIKIFDIYKKGFKYLYLGDKAEPGNDEVDLVPEKKNAQ